MSPGLASFDPTSCLLALLSSTNCTGEPGAVTTNRRHFAANGTDWPAARTSQRGTANRST